MTPPVSATLTPREMRGLLVVGDFLAPAHGALPAFSATGCACHADAMLRWMPQQDVADIRMLLRLLSYLPRPGVALVLSLLRAHRLLPGPPGALLRMAEIALKGLVMTLYYSGKVGPGYAGAVPNVIIGFTPRMTPPSPPRRGA